MKSKLIKAVNEYMVWGVLGLAGFAVAWGTIEYADYIRLLKVDKIVITGAEIVDPAAVQALLQLNDDSILSQVEPEFLQQELIDIAYIRAARISRRFPSTLVVDIVENIPVAVVDCGDHRFVLDSFGSILPVNARVNDDKTLPEITGFDEVSEICDQQTPDAESQVAEIMALVHELQNIPGSISQWIAEIEYMQDRITIRNDARNATEIIFNRNDIIITLPVLSAFEETLRDKRGLSDYRLIDFRVPKQVIVKEKRI